jgi:mono/diheme cytochrome c family protein
VNTGEIAMHQWRPISTVLLVAAVMLPNGPGLAQEVGDAKRGSVLALGTCSVCHAVSKGKGGSSANPLAPPFSTITEVKGMSAMALNVALLTPHHAMPNIMLDPQERADIIAYILSLKSD